MTNPKQSDNRAAISGAANSRGVPISPNANQRPELFKCQNFVIALAGHRPTGNLFRAAGANWQQPEQQPQWKIGKLKSRKSFVRFDADYLDLNDENMRRSCRRLMSHLNATSGATEQSTCPALAPAPAKLNSIEPAKDNALGGGNIIGNWQSGQRSLSAAGGKSYLRSHYERRQQRQQLLMASSRAMHQNQSQMQLREYQNLPAPIREQQQQQRASQAGRQRHQDLVVARSHELSKRRFFEKLEQQNQQRRQLNGNITQPFKIHHQADGAEEFCDSLAPATGTGTAPAPRVEGKQVGPGLAKSFAAAELERARQASNNDDRLVTLQEPARAAETKASGEAANCCDGIGGRLIGNRTGDWLEAGASLGQSGSAAAAAAAEFEISVLAEDVQTMESAGSDKFISGALFVRQVKSDDECGRANERAGSEQRKSSSSNKIDYFHSGSQSSELAVDRGEAGTPLAGSSDCCPPPASIDNERRPGRESPRAISNKSPPADSAAPQPETTDFAAAAGPDNGPASNVCEAGGSHRSRSPANHEGPETAATNKLGETEQVEQSNGNEDEQSFAAQGKQQEPSEQNKAEAATEEAPLGVIRAVRDGDLRAPASVVIGDSISAPAKQASLDPEAKVSCQRPGAANNTNELDSQHQHQLNADEQPRRDLHHYQPQCYCSPSASLMAANRLSRASAEEDGGSSCGSSGFGASVSVTSDNSLALPRKDALHLIELAKRQGNDNNLNNSILQRDDSSCNNPLYDTVGQLLYERSAKINKFLAAKEFQRHGQQPDQSSAYKLPLVGPDQAYPRKSTGESLYASLNSADIIMRRDDDSLTVGYANLPLRRKPGERPVELPEYATVKAAALRRPPTGLTALTGTSENDNNCNSAASIKSDESLKSTSGSSSAGFGSDFQKLSRNNDGSLTNQPSDNDSADLRSNAADEQRRGSSLFRRFGSLVSRAFSSTSVATPPPPPPPASTDVDGKSSEPSKGLGKSMMRFYGNNAEILEESARDGATTGIGARRVENFANTCETVAEKSQQQQQPQLVKTSPGEQPDLVILAAKHQRFSDERMSRAAARSGNHRRSRKCCDRKQQQASSQRPIRPASCSSSESSSSASFSRSSSLDADRRLANRQQPARSSKRFDSLSEELESLMSKSSSSSPRSKASKKAKSSRIISIDCVDRANDGRQSALGAANSVKSSSKNRSAASILRLLTSAKPAADSSPNLLVQASGAPRKRLEARGAPPAAAVAAASEQPISGFWGFASLMSHNHESTWQSAPAPARKQKALDKPPETNIYRPSGQHLSLNYESLTRQPQREHKNHSHRHHHHHHHHHKRRHHHHRHSTCNHKLSAKDCKAPSDVWGQLVKINRSSGSQVIELQRLADKSWGFFVARGSINNTRGIFISRIIEDQLDGLLSVGDRILAIDDYELAPAKSAPSSSAAADEYDILKVNQLISKKSKILLKVKPFKG